MAGSVNKVIIVGNVGRDPEARNTQEGGKVVNLSVATSESWTNKSSGQRQERTEWHRVVIFNEHLAKVAEDYLRKGSSVYIEGQLQTRKWTDQKGQDRYTTEVVLQRYRGELTLRGSKPDNEAGAGEYRRASGGGADPNAGTPGDLNDEIPFITAAGDR